MSYGNGIKLTTGFDVGAKSPLDNKSVVETIEERDAFVTDNLVYEGLEVYVKETKTKYRYNGTEWEVANGGAGLSAEQAQQLETAYEHSQSTHVNASDIPTKVSDLANDSSFVTQTEMTTAINNAQLGGGDSGDIDLSIYQTIQEDTLTTTATTIPEAINELKSGLDGITVPTKVSELSNDSGYITSSDIPDVSVYQTKNDSTLTTTNKTIVGAINELKDTIDNGTGSGITDEEKQQLQTAYEHSQSIHVSVDDIPEVKPEVLYTFTDAYTQWCKGEKFPIAFFGDSTIDGNTTTGYVANTLGKDSTSTNTFCNVLQTLLREECSNSILRIYNAGFSGQTLPWAVANFDKEFGTGTAYSDVKMIGIGFGINDRLAYDDLNAYREGIKTNLISLINKCYEKRIQPFLLTGQSTLECGIQSNYVSTFPLRDSNSVNIANNEIRRELAKEYGIELIDISKYTKIYLENSLEDSNNITTDRLHFSDIGHKYEAGMIFAHIVPRVIEVEGNEECLITYANQNLKEAIPEEKISYGGKLKTYAQYTKSDSNDTIIMDTYVFIKDKPSTISALKTGLVNLTHIKLDDVDMDAPLDVNNLGKVDLGLHHLVAYSGASAKVDFCGFGINDNFKNEVVANGLNYKNTMGYFGTDNTVMPSVVVPNHDTINNTTSLSGKTITKVVLPIKTAGKLTIGKCDMKLYNTGASPILIASKQYDVVVGDNTIDVDIVLGKNETLCMGNVGDTAIPYFAMSSGGATPNVYEYTKVYTPPQYADALENSSIVFCGAFYQEVSNINSDIPTKTSDLTNDSGFVTVEDVPTKTSDLTNDKNFVTQAEMVDAINNAQLGGGDSGTEIDLSIYQQKESTELITTDKTIVGAINELKDAVDNGGNTITKVSELENDSGFISTTVTNSTGTVAFSTTPSNITAINGGCYATYAVKGGWCFADFTVGITKVSSSASSYTTVGTGFPPALKTIYIPLHSEKGVVGTSFTISIDSSGQVKLMVSGNTLSAQDFYLGFIAFPVKES